MSGEYSEVAPMVSLKKILNDTFSVLALRLSIKACVIVNVKFSEIVIKQLFNFVVH